MTVTRQKLEVGKAERTCQKNARRKQVQLHWINRSSQEEIGKWKNKIK